MVVVAGKGKGRQQQQLQSQSQRQPRITSTDFRRAHRLAGMLEHGGLGSSYESAKWIYKAFVAYCILNELDFDDICERAKRELVEETALGGKSVQG